jgi:hypothetical protein
VSIPKVQGIDQQTFDSNPGQYKWDADPNENIFYKDGTSISVSSTSGIVKRIYFKNEHFFPGAGDLETALHEGRTGFYVKGNRYVVVKEGKNIGEMYLGDDVLADPRLELSARDREFLETIHGFTVGGKYRFEYNLVRSLDARSGGSNKDIFTIEGAKRKRGIRWDDRSYMIIRPLNTAGYVKDGRVQLVIEDIRLRYDEDRRKGRGTL